MLIADEASIEHQQQAFSACMSLSCSCSNVQLSWKERRGENKEEQQLTSLCRDSTPAAEAMLEDVVPEPLVLLRRPQPLPVVHLGLLAGPAPHCRCRLVFLLLLLLQACASSSSEDELLQ